jgi:MoxR-like ATPase
LDVVMRGDELIAYQELLTHVPTAEPLLHYAARLVLATHPNGDRPAPTSGFPPGAAADGVGKYVSYGASPRGMQALIRAARVYCVLDGRTSVSLDDIRRAALPALRHRIILNFEGEAEQINVDELIRRVLAAVPTPDKEAQ